MTAIAGRGVNAAVNNMTGKIIPAMRHATVIFGLILDGRFQFNADPMAITTVALPMTSGAYGSESGGHRSVVFPKKYIVIKFCIGNFRFLRIMAFSTCAQILPVFFRVPDGRSITALNRSTSDN